MFNERNILRSSAKNLRGSACKCSALFLKVSLFFFHRIAKEINAKELASLEEKLKAENKMR